MSLNLNKISMYKNIAEAIAKLSPDIETQVGCVYISNEFSLLSSGYNGFLRGSDDVSLPKTRPDKYKYMIHSEINGIINAARTGVSLKDSIVVCTHSPCESCLRSMFQLGVAQIWFYNEHLSFVDTSTAIDLKFKITRFSEMTLIERLV